MMILTNNNDDDSELETQDRQRYNHNDGGVGVIKSSLQSTMAHVAFTRSLNASGCSACTW